MYKQIFTPPIATPIVEDEKYVSAGNILKDFIKDEVFMSRSIELTKIMLENKMDLNTIGAIIKEYQTKYIYIKENAPELVSAFTPQMWWITRRK